MYPSTNSSAVDISTQQIVDKHTTDSSWQARNAGHQERCKQYLIMMKEPDGNCHDCPGTMLRRKFPNKLLSCLHGYRLTCFPLQRPFRRTVDGCPRIFGIFFAEPGNRHYIPEFW